MSEYWDSGVSLRCSRLRGNTSIPDKVLGDYALSNDSPIPDNFSWLDPSKLAGSARPENERELEGLKKLGIKAIVSLTEDPLDLEVDRLGFDYLSSPITDFEAPSQDQLGEIIQFIEDSISESKPVLVHCAAGKGRTGTVLAAYLVYHGKSAEEAINQVRAMRPGSIEMPVQQDAVRLYAKTYKT
ncbi:MAG: dual specificity protein phosphatase 23 [Candidatus Bathyarchaeia archaeon]